MQYSLKNLNKIANLKNLTLTNFIEKLNIIGLEVDEIFFDIDTFENNLRNINLTLKIPANRDDLLNEVIFLKELTSIFDLDIFNIWENIQEKYFFLLKQKYLSSSNFSTIKIESNLNCFLTYGIEIKEYNKNVKIPNWIKNRLSLNISDTENSIENLLNLTMLEWGQNFNSLEIYNTSELKIEYLPTKENFFSKAEKYVLNPGTIVLKDNENRIISVLGIITRKIPEKNIFIEASFYDIDENLLNLNDLNSRLSFRYLRRTFLSQFKFAFQRLLTLFEIILDASISLHIYKNIPKTLELKSQKILKVDKNAFKKCLNIEQYDSNIFEKSNLKLVCTTLDSLYFKIPDSRKDLKRQIDLIEEYATLIGYKNFKEILPTVSKFKSLNLNSQRNEFIQQFFLNSNFNEILTNSLISESSRHINSIDLQNPLNLDLFALRSSLTPNLIETFLKNLKFGTSFLKFFELGRVYKRDQNKLIEQDFLSIIFPIEKNKIDEKLNFFTAKGFIENFLSFFENKNFKFEKEIQNNLYFNPGKSLKIIEENKVVGHFGEIHPRYKKLFSLKQNIYLFEFNLESISLKNLKSKIKIYEDYSKYPSITKDLSMIISKQTNFYNLKLLCLKKIKYLKNINFFDIYFDNNSTEKVSLGIRLEFQSFDKTLINEEIEIEIQTLRNLLSHNFKAELK